MFRSISQLERMKEKMNQNHWEEHGLKGQGLRGLIVGSGRFSEAYSVFPPCRCHSTNEQKQQTDSQASRFAQILMNCHTLEHLLFTNML